MKVRVHPADHGGCGHYRLIWPSEALAADGYDVHVDFDHEYPVACLDTLGGRSAFGLVGDPKAFHRLAGAMAQELALAKKVGRDDTPIRTRYMTELEDLTATTGRRAVDADVVVFQRILSRQRFELMRAVQATGVAVVVEIDDDFNAIHPLNPAWQAMNPLGDPDVHRDWLARACDQADLVTVTTPKLAERYAPHGRVAIIPNCVPARYLGAKPSAYTETHLADWPACTTVGWTGSTLTHPGDLEVTEGQAAQAVADTGAALVTVGTGKGVAKALRASGPVHATGWLPIEAYPEAMSRIDVGLVPLLRSPFNEAKSWLKGLEFAAVGVPFVATPTGPYQDLHHAGIGLLADTPTDWYEQIRTLVTSPACREELGAAWRQKVEQSWTVEQNTHRWWGAWAAALENSVRRAA